MYETDGTTTHTELDLVVVSGVYRVRVKSTLRLDLATYQFKIKYKMANGDEFYMVNDEGTEILELKAVCGPDSISIWQTPSVTLTQRHEPSLSTTKFVTNGFSTSTNDCNNYEMKLSSSSTTFTEITTLTVSADKKEMIPTDTSVEAEYKFYVWFKLPHDDDDVYATFKSVLYTL